MKTASYSGLFQFSTVGLFFIFSAILSPNSFAWKDDSVHSISGQGSDIPYIRNKKKLNLHLDQEGHWYTSIQFTKDSKIQFFSGEAELVIKHLIHGSARPKAIGKPYYCGISVCRDFRFENGDTISIYEEDSHKFLDVFDPIEKSVLKLQEDPALVKLSERIGYIHPNEAGPFYFKPLLDQIEGGTLISVGTIRSMIDGGLGNFSRLVLLDVDETVVHFNKTHVVLLKALGELPVSAQFQRYQYFAFLNCHWLTNRQLHQLATIETQSNNLAWNEALLKQFDTFFSSQSRHCHSNQFPEEFRDIMDDFEILKAEEYDSSRKEFVSKPLFTISETSTGFLNIFYYHGQSRPSYYWENDADWKKLQILIKNDRIHVVVGNLYGDNTLRSLGESLGRLGEEVSVIDISNVLSYYREGFARPGESQKAKKALFLEQNKKLLDNFKNLPLARNAVLLKTSFEPVPHSKGDLDDGWFYSWNRLTTVFESEIKSYEDWLNLGF